MATNTDVNILLRVRDEASAKMKELASETGGLLGAVQRLSGGFGFVGAGITALGTVALASYRASTQLADKLEQIDRNAAKTGVGIQPMQAMFKIIEDGGGSTEALVSALVRLNREIAQGNPELVRRGITTRDTAAAFVQLAGQLAQTSDVGTVTSSMMDLMGKSSVDLIPHLSDLAKNVDGVTEAMLRNGTMISEQVAPQLRKLDEGNDRLKANWSGLWQDLSMTMVGPSRFIIGRLVDLVALVDSMGRSIHDFVFGPLADLDSMKNPAPSPPDDSKPRRRVAVGDMTLPEIEVVGKRISPGDNSPTPWLEEAYEARRRAEKQQQAETEAFAKSHFMIGGIFRRVPGGPGMQGAPLKQKENPFADVLKDWNKTVDDVLKSTSRLNGGLQSIWDGLQSGTQSVIQNMLNGTGTVMGAVSTMLHSLGSSILSYLAELVSAEVFKLFLKLAASLVNPAAGVLIPSVNPLWGAHSVSPIPGGGSTSFASASPSAGAAPGGNTYVIQTFAARDVMHELTNGSFRSANSRLREIAAAS